MTDFEYLQNATGLNTGSLISLMEEDFDSLLESLSSNDIQPTIAEVSFPLFTRLTIFRASKDTGFPLAEKAYVSEAVSIQYPKVFKKSHYLIDQSKIGEFSELLVNQAVLLHQVSFE